MVRKGEPEPMAGLPNEDVPKAGVLPPSGFLAKGEPPKEVPLAAGLPKGEGLAARKGDLVVSK